MKIGKDKQKHFYVGFILATGFHLLFQYLFGISLSYSIFLNLLLIFCIAYAFELFSKYSGHGHYEMNDVWATLLGGVLAVVICSAFLP